MSDLDDDVTRHLFGLTVNQVQDRFIELEALQKRLHDREGLAKAIQPTMKFITQDSDCETACYAVIDAIIRYATDTRPT